MRRTLFELSLRARQALSVTERYRADLCKKQDGRPALARGDGRPPSGANERAQTNAAAQAVLTLKTAWHDDTTDPAVAAMPDQYIAMP